MSQRPVVSARGQAMPASPIRKLMPLADAAKKRGIHVYHLNIGQPDIETPAAMRERLALVDKVIAYTPSGGTPDFLASLQRLLRAARDRARRGRDHRHHRRQRGGARSRSSPAPGRATRRWWSSRSTPTTTPSRRWPAYASCRCAPAARTASTCPPRAAWEQALTPRTRMVMLCNPNNPTGTVYTRDEMLMVAQFCRTTACSSSSDEVYRELVYDGNRTTSALSLAGFADTIVASTACPSATAPAASASAASSPATARCTRRAHRMAQGRLSAPGLAQLIAVGATELGPDYFDGIVAEYQARRDVLYEGLKDHARCLPAQARGRLLLHRAAADRRFGRRSQAGC